MNQNPHILWNIISSFGDIFPDKEERTKLAAKINQIEKTIQQIRINSQGTEAFYKLKNSYPLENQYLIHALPELTTMFIDACQKNQWLTLSHGITLPEGSAFGGRKT